MWRQIGISLIPMTALLAHMTAAPKPAFQGVQNQLSLDPIVLVPDVKNSEAGQLAALLAGAQNGDMDAQGLLGTLYYLGRGVPVDWGEAQVWFRKAAAQGRADAQVKLGVMCFLGQGMPRDLFESVKWFRMAAEQGEIIAQYCLGAMYAQGKGVPKDLVEAYGWFLQALAGGDANAAMPCQAIQTQLTPRQIKEGYRRAKEAIRMRGKAQKTVRE